MGSRSQRTGTPARPRHVSRRQAAQAREELAADGLSHHERRALHTVLRSRAATERDRRRQLTHLVITVTGAAIVMVIVALSFGLIPAIAAANGGGATGSFVVMSQVCSTKTGCQWVGTFKSADGESFTGLAYGGVLPAGDGPGSIIPARYPRGSEQVYALRGSHTWVYDLIITLVVGTAAGAALWISPLGERSRHHSRYREDSACT